MKKALKCIILILIFISAFVAFSACEDAITVSDIQVTAPTKLEYVYGEKLDFTGGEVLITYSNGTEKSEPLNDELCGMTYVLSIGTEVDGVYMLTVPVAVEGKSGSFDIKVNLPTQPEDYKLTIREDWMLYYPNEFTETEYMSTSMMEILIYTYTEIETETNFNINRSAGDSTIYNLSDEELKNYFIPQIELNGMREIEFFKIERYVEKHVKCLELEYTAKILSTTFHFKQKVYFASKNIVITFTDLVSDEDTGLFEAICENLYVFVDSGFNLPDA